MIGAITFFLITCRFRRGIKASGLHSRHLAGGLDSLIINLLRKPYTIIVYLIIFFVSLHERDSSLFPLNLPKEQKRKREQ